VAESSKAQDGRIVVKIGGSLAETDRLADVLALISRAARPVIVVPGGGAFADKVRDLQNALRFDDRSAHRLAILGMHQMAELYFTLAPRLAPFDSLEGLARVFAVGQIPVWLPWKMTELDDSIPADWSITSDGLAARLAEQLGGLPVVLLKSVDADATWSAERLADEGIVDPVFPLIVQRARLDWRVFGPGDDRALAAMIAAENAPILNS
jgi:aspartokinase-like uncharacterized kinase